MKSDTTQLEREISAVKTVLGVSKLLIANINDEGEKKKLTDVLETIYSEYISRLVSKSALEIAVREYKLESVSKDIANRAVYHIDSITEYLKEKGIVK